LLVFQGFELPSPKELRYSGLRKLIADGKVDEALKTVDRDDMDFLLELGISLAKQSKLRTAEAVFNRMIGLNEKSIEGWTNKGIVLAFGNQHDEAIHCYDKAIEIDPNYAVAWMNKGLTLEKLGKYDDAVQCYDKAIELDSQNWIHLYNKGTTLLHLGRHNEAIECYNRALQISPNNPAIWSNGGIALQRLGRYDEAIAYHNKAVEFDPTSALAWVNKGAALEIVGKHDEAIQCYDKAFEIDPQFAKVWSYKAVQLRLIGKNEEAIESFNKAIELDPRLFEAWFGRGVALQENKRYDEAIHCYDKAIEIDPNHLGPWVNKGVALEKTGKYNEAIQCHDRALEIDPNLVMAWNNKATALSKVSKHDEAMKCYQRALEIDPNNSIAWYNKGLEHARMGQLNQAIICFSKSIETNPTLPEAHANLGITLSTLRRYDVASSSLAKAEELFLKKGAKEDAQKARSEMLLATNASDLLSQMNSLDKEFRSCLGSQSLANLRERSLKLSRETELVIRKFEHKNIPRDSRILLNSKADCFAALSEAMQFFMPDLTKLHDAKVVLEKWGEKSFVTAINSLDTFVRRLGEYASLEQVPKEVEVGLLLVLKASLLLDGTLTDTIINKFRGEPFSFKQQGEDSVEVQRVFIAERKTGWVRVCLVQLDFSISETFPFRVEQEEEVRRKVFSALDIARNDHVNIICFPELSFSEQWIDDVREMYKDMIVVCGSYYDQNKRNVCRIVTNGQDYAYAKCHPSIFEEGNGEGMVCGNRLLAFQTSFGSICVLTCIDYDEEQRRIEKQRVDLIINPRFDPDEKHGFHTRANISIDRPDGSRNPTFSLFVNAEDTSPGQAQGGGGTAIFGFEHKYRIATYKSGGLRPKDNLEYKIFQARNEMMLIADLRIGDTTERRTRTANWYMFKENSWMRLMEKGIWLNE